MNKRKNAWQTSKLERMAYISYFIGQLIFYTVVTSFALTYLLNRGFNEVIIGSILIVPKIWDAVNDSLFGVVVDKVRFKKGRFLPWIRISTVFMPLATIFFFSVPDGLSETVKCVWIIIGYILWDSAYTMCDVPIYALSTSMTSDINERTSILSGTRLAGAIGGILVSMLVPSLYGVNGANLGWNKTALVLSVLGALFMLPICFLGKERFHSEQEKEPKFKDLWNGFIHNRYLLVFQISRFVCYLTLTLEVLNAVFSQYVIGDETFGTIMSMAIGLPVIVVALLIPALVRKWDKVYILVFFMAFFSGMSIIQYFVGYQNTSHVLLLTALKCLGYGGFFTLSYMFVPDCIEYGQYVTGERNEGISFGLQTFVGKMNSALISSIAAFIIASMGFSAQNVTPQGAHGVWFAITLIASIGPILSIPIILLFYKLRDKDVKIMAQYNNGEITREESTALLTRDYGIYEKCKN